MESRLSLVTCMISTSVLLLSSSTKKSYFIGSSVQKRKAQQGTEFSLYSPVLWIGIVLMLIRIRILLGTVTKFYTSWKIRRKNYTYGIHGIHSYYLVQRLLRLVTFGKHF